MALDLELHGLLMLDWLYEQSGDEPWYFDANEFALLVWLHVQEHNGTPAPDWEGFINGLDAQFYGSPFTAAELERAIKDLVNRNLVTGLMNVDQTAKGMVRPELTTDGRDCVIDYGGNVSEYLNRPQGGTTNNTTNITMTDSNGNITVASKNVMQSIASGFDPRQVLDFAAMVKESLPVVRLPEDQKSELETQAEELHKEASASTPDKGKLRNLIDAIMAGLTTAAPAIMAKTAIALGDDALKAISS